MQLSKDIKFVRVKVAVAAGTTDVESDIVDRAGFDGVIFLALLGAITADGVQGLRVQQNTANSTSGMADLTGASVTIADTDDNKGVFVDVYRPKERYLRAILDRATQNAVLDGMLAILYCAKNKPTTHDVTTFLAGAVVAGPAEA